MEAQKLNKRVLGEQSKYEIFKYLITIGDYKTAFRSLFWRRPKWKLSILYTNNQRLLKTFKYRSDAINFVNNEGDHVANYVIYEE